LAPNDPSVERLRADWKNQVDNAGSSVDELLSSLEGVDHMGSLFKLEAAVDAAVSHIEVEHRRAHRDTSGGLPRAGAGLPAGEPRRAADACLHRFLAARSSSNDIGLELDGEPTTAGLRFLRIARESTYDIVVGNPPYFGTQALAETEYIDKNYASSKENLCTAMIERAMDLARDNGQVAFVAVRNWLYVSQLSEFRANVFRTFPPACAADLGLGGFESLPGVEVIMVVLRRRASECQVVDARTGGPREKAARLECADTRYTTQPAELARLPGSPFVYRWSKEALADYLSRPRLGDVAPVRVGMKTSDNLRFLRRPWELSTGDARRAIEVGVSRTWVPYVKGAAGKAWLEPLTTLVQWRDGGLEVRLALEAAYAQAPQGEKHFLKRGVAFSTIGRRFLARAHRYPSIFDVAGSSVFPPDIAAAVCLLNSRFARDVVEDLNPTINFQVGDVARIPYRTDGRATDVLRVLEEAFAQHEANDELSPGFRRPGPSPWRHAQRWAQGVVDSPEAEGLPPYTPDFDPPSPFAAVSFAVGVALGRFGSQGDGWIDEASESALPSGILFVSAAAGPDSLDHEACKQLTDVWRVRGGEVSGDDDLRMYLRRSFFGAHKKLYDNRPIYFPVSSDNRNFVALISIHRWSDDTLSILLADHLLPTKRALECELVDVRRSSSARGGHAGDAERRELGVHRLLAEIRDLIAKVTEVADKGPSQPDRETPQREVDARYAMTLEDGVMVNSAALWPLVAPQWKEPKKWWKQVASRSGPKGTHFDWSSAAARYFPTRVRSDCERDPVIAAAHRCLWRYHPKVAYRWELHLDRDLESARPVSAANVEECRTRLLRQEPQVAREIGTAEMKRKKRRSMAR
jgi:hypothetical protein